MKMESFFYPYHSSSIHYTKAGIGRRLLICFHGYGEDAGSFAFLEEELGRDFTIVSIDMPFHGATDWQGGLDFDSGDLVEIMEGIGRARALDLSRLTLMGFSMGGRVVLGLIPLMKERIERIVLLAPDGLKVNFWYWLATQNAAGNRLFRSTMKYPGWFLRTMQWGNGLGLVNKSVFKFSMSYLEDPVARENLYRRWTVTRKLGCTGEELKKLIRTHQIPIRIIYGEHDRIIRFERGIKFKQGIEEYCQMTVLPSGHQLLQPKNLQAILSVL